MTKEIDVVSYFRARHHAVAQCIAMGMTDSMIRRQMGLSMRQLTLYKQDPAFDDLITHYVNKQAEDFPAQRDYMRELLTENMIRAEATVQEHFDRADDAGELIPIQVANKISQERADRLGYSKHSVVRHEHDFAAALDRAISRSNAVLIEGEVVSGELSANNPPKQLTSQEPVPTAPQASSHTAPAVAPARPSIASIHNRRRLA